MRAAASFAITARGHIVVDEREDVLFELSLGKGALTCRVHGVGFDSGLGVIDHGTLILSDAHFPIDDQLLDRIIVFLPTIGECNAFSTVFAQTIEQLYESFGRLDRLVDENDDLREQLAQAHLDIAALRGQVEALRGAVAKGNRPWIERTLAAAAVAASVFYGHLAHVDAERSMKAASAAQEVEVHCHLALELLPSVFVDLPMAPRPT